MDRSHNKRRSFTSQEENEREEEKESYRSSAGLNQKSRYGEKSDVDDQILLEFKKKYQKSLEAIQSFQEILELKKNYTSITHSYYPVIGISFQSNHKKLFRTKRRKHKK